MKKVVLFLAILGWISWQQIDGIMIHRMTCPNHSKTFLAKRDFSMKVMGTGKKIKIGKGTLIFEKDDFTERWKKEVQFSILQSYTATLAEFKSHISNGDMIETPIMLTTRSGDWARQPV